MAAAAGWAAGQGRHPTEEAEQNSPDPETDPEPDDLFFTFFRRRCLLSGVVASEVRSIVESVQDADSHDWLEELSSSPLLFFVLSPCATTTTVPVNRTPAPTAVSKAEPDVTHLGRRGQLVALLPLLLGLHTHII
ncbi:hypothetical protein ACJJTC_002074 [Scirpophaga incertulas]